MSMSTFDVHTSLAFDPVACRFVRDLSLTIDPADGSIRETYTRKDGATNLCLRDGDIDLRGKVVMPGFVDAHTHMFLHAYWERPAQEQMMNESIPERTIRASQHLLRALQSGFTTYRDLGSEGMYAFDASMRNLVNRQITPGPRLFVATEALTSTGSYRVRTENDSGVGVPRIADECDGPWGVRRAVRRRVADGADVIKFYADYRRKVMRFPPVQTHPYIGGMPFPPSEDQDNPPVVMFTMEEMSAIVDEARMAGLPVACHASTEKGALMACRAGVTSLEHGAIGSTELLREMAHRGTIYVPTLAATETIRPEAVRKAQEYAREAVMKFRVRIAAGGDTGVFDHGDGVREMELLMEAGIPVEKVLQACMVHGWEACGGKASGYTFGRWEEGARADVVALETDPREDGRALRKVEFVMKDGKVWKRDGVARGMGDVGVGGRRETEREEVDEDEKAEEDWVLVSGGSLST